MCKVIKIIDEENKSYTIIKNIDELIQYTKNKCEQYIIERREKELDKMYNIRTIIREFKKINGIE